jgi:hypothetical protein
MPQEEIGHLELGNCAVSGSVSFYLTPQTIRFSTTALVCICTDCHNEQLFDSMISVASERA